MDCKWEAFKTGARTIKKVFPSIRVSNNFHSTSGKPSINKQPTIVGIRMDSFEGKTKVSRGLTLLALMFAFVLGMQPALAGNQVPFRVSYNNNISADFSNLPMAPVTSSGTILGTHFGNGTARAISELVNLATGEGVAVHELTAANGDTVRLSFHFLAIPTSATTFSVVGGWEIVGGTGRYDGASGEGLYSGVVTFNSPTTGTGDFKLSGTISSVGSLK
jgi:hypothetical protein